MVKRNESIICTLGPASENKNIISKMADYGMGIVRLNFSHGDHEYHQHLIDLVREINKEKKTAIKILQDLEGYRIRVARLRKPILLLDNQEIWIVKEGLKGEGFLPIDKEIRPDKFKKGMDVYIDDGFIHLTITKCLKNRIKTKVITGGYVSSHKGVNIPDLMLKSNILTEKDQDDIKFGIRNEVDYIAQSFVRNVKDIFRVKQHIVPFLPKGKVIAKIENREGVNNIDEIIEGADGIMIARGDLGVSVPIYEVPFIQKEIIRQCRRRNKCVITATQMLESMTEKLRPTRAEVNDVANAILDGTDYVMLSAETAAGKYPVESVKTMMQIVEYAKKFKIKN